MDLEQLRVSITAQTQGFKNSMKQLTQSLKNLGSQGKKSGKQAGDGIADGISDGTKRANNSMNGLNSTVSKLGKSIALALSVAKITEFAKECVKLGSDLEESANVVNVTFAGLTSQVEEFTSKSAELLGISKAEAQQQLGVIGTMSKASGLAKQQALEFSKDVMTLGADIQSFYNMTAGEVDTMIKSLYTGETEPFKRIGVDISVAAVEAYKATHAVDGLTNAQIRYQMVCEQTADAQGDMARSSGSWANQVRLLSANFANLKANIGTGLLTVLTPVIRVINTLMAKLVQLSEKFVAVLSAMGFNVTSAVGSGISDMTDVVDTASSSLSGVSDAVDNATSGVSNLGAVADATKKKLKEMMGIDELNIIKSTDTDSSSDSGSGSTGSGAGSGLDGTGDLALEEAEKVEEASSKIANALMWCVEKARLFKKGFNEAFDMNLIEDVKQSFLHLSDAISGVFADGKILGAVDNLLNSIMYNLGKATGSVADTTLRLVNTLIEGLARGIEEKTNFIKEKLVSIFDIQAEINDLVGNIFVDIKDIFEVFGEESAIEFVDNFVQTCITVGLTVAELGQKLGRDLIDGIHKTIDENKEKIKTALSGILNVFSDVMETIKTHVDIAAEKVSEFYDEHIKPFVDYVGDAISRLVGYILDGWNTYIQPVLDEIASEFDELMDEVIQPLIDKFLDFGSSLIECIQAVWDFLEPIVKWLIDVFFKNVSEGIKTVWFLVKTAAEIIEGCIETVLGVISGILDFITGVFTGDWEKAWDGITKIFESFRDGSDKICESLKTLINKAFEWIKGIVVEVITKMKDKALELWEQLKEAIKEKVEKIKTSMQEKWESIKSVVSEKIENIKKTVVEKWDAIKKAPGEAIDKAKTLLATAWEGVKTTVSNKIESIKTNVTTTWNNIKKAIVSPIETARDLVGKAIDKMKSFFNFSWELPKIKLPHFKVSGKFSLNPPSVPSFGIEWYKNGGIMTSPTMFGFNPLTGKSMVGGEAGAEAILPLQKLWDEQNALFNKYLGGNNRQAQPMNLTIKVGNGTLGKIVIDDIHALERSTGAEYLLT